MEALDASSSNYLNVNMLKILAESFPCYEINQTVLRIEADRAKHDFDLGIPLNKTRIENLHKLVTLKNTTATTTVTVERAFSGMNRICTKIRSKVTPDRLSDLLFLALNKDILMAMDLVKLVRDWAQQKGRRFVL